MLNIKFRERYLCVKCGERDPKEFYAHALTVCKTDYKGRVIAVRKERKLRHKASTHLSPKEMVKSAIAQGCRTRQEIKAHTKLPMDELCDILAELYDKENLVLRAA